MALKVELEQRVAELEAELDALRSQFAVQLATHVELVQKASIVAPLVDFAGMTSAEICAAATTAVLGAAFLADKSEAYVAARFAILSEEAARRAAATQRAVEAAGTAAAIDERIGETIVIAAKAGQAVGRSGMKH